jgi:hypothetical protein
MQGPWQYRELRAMTVSISVHEIPELLSIYEKLARAMYEGAKGSPEIAN